LLGAILFAFAFVAGLTAVVRLCGLVVRGEVGAARLALLTGSFVTVTVGLWTAVTLGERIEDRLLSPLILPSPMEVLRGFGPLQTERGLVRSAFTSLGRVSAGFLLGALLAVPLGVYMGTFRAVSAFFRPLALSSAYVPLVVYLPLTLVWWGSEETQKIGFLAICCFVALLPLVIKSVADVPSALLDVTVTKGATQWQLVSKVLFPVALADIWDHMRGVYGVGWTWIIVAEMVVKAGGLGDLIDTSVRRSRQGEMFAVIVVIIVLAFGCDQLWKMGGNALFPHRRASHR
jgi:NitT/TauT family transport system permease protein